ncbi:MAG: hypothetical protein Q7T72_09855 [Bacteroidales bacterium]|nr:hypothetical protein [Bacteroidales bacterium]
MFWFSMRLLNRGQTESRQERMVRLTGFDPRRCPVCKTGFMHTVELLPKIRAPSNVLYPAKELSYSF